MAFTYFFSETIRRFRNVRILAADIDESNGFERIIAEGAYPRELVQRIPEDKEISRVYVETGRLFLF